MLTMAMSSVGKAVKAVGALAVTAVAGGLAYSFLGVDHDVDLPPAIDAEQRAFQSEHAGTLNYYVDASGSGAPLVLVHSINAAPSAHEMRPLFEYFRGKRPVYALDLPGFGFSDRGPRDYTPELFAQAINDFLRSEVGATADVVALSLSSEFLARAALAEPAQFRSLALITPTGLNERPFQMPPDALYSFFTFPLWSQALFDLITSKPSIGYYTGQSFVGEPPQAFLSYAYATSHQPGARFAPLHFLGGHLFTPDARTALYGQTTQPGLILYDQDPNINFGSLPALLEANNQWQAVRIAPTMGLPHWEKLDETVAALTLFWHGLPTP